MHAVFLIANTSYCPYFTWFAARSKLTPDVKITFVFLHNERPVMIEEIEGSGCKCYWLPFDSEKRIVSMIKVIPGLVQLLKKLRPDIVHTHLFDDSLPGLLAARIARVKIRVITKQDAFFHWNFVRDKVIYDKINNYNATHIIAVSEETKEFILEKEKAPAAKVKMIHHGIVSDDVSSISEQQKKVILEKYRLEGKIVITIVARYIEWKGYKLIIEASQAIIKKYPSARFLFVGFGDQMSELQGLVDNNNLTEFICLTGFVLPKDVTIIYSISNIFLHVALNEPFGFVIAEAMMYRVPVVSVITGAARDAIKSGENGHLIRERTPEAIANAVISVLNMDDYSILGERGQRTAQEMYNFNLMWKRYVDLYKSAVK